MSGSDQNNSSDNEDCHPDESDSIEEFVAAMAGLSISGQRCPPICAAHNKDPQITTKPSLSRLLETTESTDAQGKPQKPQRDDVLSEEDIRQFVLLSINEEEPEPNVPEEEERTYCERTERAVKAEKPKLRRGGVIHKSENNCCPVLPSIRPLPRRDNDLQTEDI